ncbi:hypothetical protein PV05_11382 [Exophiala xenobiotica]|uniref:Uncharacterized protein n=1 Tax=Exophiala xenobiotica TaxID=348802 RepID=A0A0D2CIK5_9EURO|nr:uncharacterized protein PV05_11382 [Exophiala xenobiotica]KIW49732.1 hypothetical protein PV05_11382 [Exophiala xenobiotica]
MVTTRLQEKLGHETPNSSGIENTSSAKGSPSVTRASKGRGTPRKTESKSATASKSSRVTIEIGPSPLAQHATPAADDKKELPERLKSPSTFYTPGKTPANKRKRFASDEPEDSILETFKTPAEYPRTHNEIPSTEDEDDDDDAPEVLSSKATPQKARGAPTRAGRGSGRKRRKAATDVANDASIILESDTVDVARTQPTLDEALAEAEAEVNEGVASDATAVGDQVDATHIPTTTTNPPLEETNAATSHEAASASADTSAAVDSVDDPQSTSLEDRPEALEDTITVKSVPEAADMDCQRKTAADADKLESTETPDEHLSSTPDSATVPGPEAEAEPERETKVPAPSSTITLQEPSDSAPLPEPSATNPTTTSLSSEHIPTSAIRTTAQKPQSQSHSNLNKAKSAKTSSISTRQQPASALLHEHLPKPKPTSLHDFRSRLLNRHPRTTNFGPPGHKRVKFVGA